MAIERREALLLLAGGAAGSLLPLPLRAEATGGAEVVDRLYLSTRADATGGYRVSGFAVDGAKLFDLPLPGRGHSFAVHPSGRTCVHFARRPGRFALVLNLVQGIVVRRLGTPPDRHFYGHGVFSPDGRLLYATENDFGGERGVIGVYDAERGYRRAGELPSHGIGPHEIGLLSDGETLVVANGGIATRPDLPRVKLNLPTMAPSLYLVDRCDGTLLQERRLDPALHQLSIRHLAVGPEDTVAVAMQYEGPAGDLVPLVAVWRGVEGFHLLRGPAAVLRAMKHYCGSVCFDPSGRTIAASALRGGIVTFWDVGAGRYLSSARSRTAVASHRARAQPNCSPAAGRATWSSSTRAPAWHGRSPSIVSKLAYGTTTWSWRQRHRCCSASPFDPSESQRINALPRRSASNLHAEKHRERGEAQSDVQSEGHAQSTREGKL